MTVLAISDMSAEERARLDSLPRRLPAHALFRVGPQGLQEISDATLDLLIDAEALRHPGCTLSQLAPLEAV